MALKESPPRTDPQTPRFHLSAVQLIASALAAVTAAVAASYLGVNGTVIGAAVASLLSVVGNAVYSHSLQRTGQRVRTAVPASAKWLPPRAVTPTPVRADPAPTGVLRRIGFATAAVFVAALAILTTVEVVAGRPISDLLRDKTASGTTVFGSQTAPRSSTPAVPTPTVTVTVVPKVVTVTPTVTQTAPTTTVTPSPAATPTVTPTTSPTPTPTQPTTAPTP